MTPPFDERQREALRLLSRAWDRTPMVLIGAGALGCSLPMTWRNTHDLDLVVVREQQDATAELSALGFVRHPGHPHRWRAQSGAALDILPADRRELALGKVTWRETGVTMSLAGMNLALRHNVEVSLGETDTLRVATLPVLTLLKMVSWLERPAERERDLVDIGYILAEYLPDAAMRRWEDPRLTDLDFEVQGAAALGHDLRQIALPSHSRIAREFLAAAGKEGTAYFDRLARASATTADPEEVLAQRLSGFRAGLGLDRVQRRGRSR